MSERFRLILDGGRTVSALLLCPPGAQAAYVMAHGAGAGMEHRSLTTLAEGLNERGIATLRFLFPFMEERSRRPDPPALAHATIRAAVAEAARLLPGLALFAGGRSFGGRMTSQAQAGEPLPGVRGLIFLAFPLHPAGRPSIDRAAHLADVSIPMLFLQGTRDALADQGLLRTVTASLGDRADLKLLEHADHAFHVPARSGRTDEQVRTDGLDAIREWIDRVMSPSQ